MNPDVGMAGAERSPYSVAVHTVTSQPRPGQAQGQAAAVAGTGKEQRPSHNRILWGHHMAPKALVWELPTKTVVNMSVSQLPELGQGAYLGRPLPAARCCAPCRKPSPGLRNRSSSHRPDGR